MASTHTDTDGTSTPAGFTARDTPSPGSHAAADRRRRAGVGGVGAVVAGGLGAIAGFIPRLGVLAVALGLVALASGAGRARADEPGTGRQVARVGVALAVVAIVVGVVNIAIQLDLFAYFTADD